MSDWSPPQADLESDVNMGEGLTPPFRISEATQAARDQKAALLRVTYESGGDPTGLGDVEARIQKVAGGKSKQAAALKAWTPPTQDLAFTPPEANAPTQPAAAKPESGDVGAALLGGIGAANRLAGALNPANLLTDEEKAQILHDNPIATAYRFVASQMKVANAVNTLRTPDEDGITPIEREIVRRRAAGEPTDPRTIEQWVDTEARKQVFGEPKEAPPVKEQLKQIYQQAINNPAQFARSFIVGSLAHPEYLAMGPVVGLAAIAGESVMEQKADAGAVDANKLMTDVVTAGVPVAAFHAAVRLANLTGAKAAGVTPKSSTEEVALKAINEQAKENMAAGMPADDAATVALNNVLDAMKVPPEERAQLVKGASDAVGEGVKQESNLAEHPNRDQGGAPAEAGGSDRVQRGGQEPQAEVGPGQVDLTRKQRLDGPSTTMSTPEALDAAVKKVGAEEFQRIATDQLERFPADDRLSPDDKAWLTAIKTENVARNIVDGLGEKYAKSRETRRATFGPAELIPEMPEARNVRFLNADSLRSDLKPPEALPVNLNEVRSEIGWAETGGRIIRDPTTGDVIGRTKWIPKSDFWGDRPANVTEKDAHAALDRAEAGEKLTPKQQKFIDYARKTIEKRNEEALAPAREAYEERLAIQQYGRADPRLLALLALPGVGAAAGYWLGGKDTYDKVRGALIGSGLGAATLMLGKVRSAATRVAQAVADKRYNPEDLFNSLLSDRQMGRLAAYQTAEGMKAMVPNAARRSEMTFALEDGDLSKLSPAERIAVETGTKTMRAARDAAVARGVEMGGIIDNYATHAYVRGANTQEGLLDNLLNIMKEQGGTGGMSPKSRWAKQRVIPTYREAIARGLMPATTDFSDIVRMYVESVTRTVANKNFLDAVAKHQTKAGEPLIAKAADLESEIKRRASVATGEMAPSTKLDADLAAIQAPRDYVFINHPQLRNFKVHRDVAAPLRALMDATEPLAIEKAAHGLAVAAKSIIFSGSLFHAKSLVDAGMGAGPAAFRRGALKSIRDPNNEMVKLAVHSGLNIIDRPMEAEIAPMRNALRLIEAKTPFPISTPVKGMRYVQDNMNHFLWGVVHPTLKWNVWSSIFERATNPSAFQKVWNQFGRKLGMAPNWDKMSPYDIAKVATSFTNDIFGGIDWFRIANETNTKYLRDMALAFASPRGRRLMQILMLAPDWTVATARSFYKAFPGMSEPQVAALHRQYLLRQGIIYLTAYNAINVAMSGHNIWENKDPTMIDAGDGRRIQMAKHTMEPIHWLTQPAQQAFNKLGYPIKEPALQLLGKDWISLKGPDVAGPPMTNRLTHALKGMLPIPSTTAVEHGAGPAISGFVGVPIYGRTEEQATNDAIERALGVYKQKQEAGTPQRYKSEAQAEDAARRRVQRRYEKSRQEQANR